MHVAPKAKTVSRTARLPGFEDKKHTHWVFSHLVREDPSCSRFTHWASSVAGGLACSRSGQGAPHSLLRLFRIVIWEPVAEAARAATIISLKPQLHQSPVSLGAKACR